MTQEQVKALFDYHEDGYLVWKEDRRSNKVKGARAGSLDKSGGYWVIGINGMRYRIHRLIYLFHHGSLPDLLDHEDRNPLNNKIDNLRPATKAENATNAMKSKKASSPWRGVTWDKRNKCWRAQITIGGKLHHLGRFACGADAAMVWNEAAAELHTKFAVLNDNPLNHLEYDELLVASEDLKSLLSTKDPSNLLVIIGS